MPEEPEFGIGLADAIEILRAELLRTHAAPGASKLRFPVESLTIELKVAATRSAEGKAGIRVPFVNAELGGSTEWERDTMQTVTVTFGPPVDEAGSPVKVSSSSDDLMG